jgi:tetratricopeptide (TPR) repeat protein
MVLSFKSAIKSSYFLAIILIITLITYINILPNKLFFDDEELIYRNLYVSDLKYLPKYFTQNMIAGAGKTSNMYRPILLLSLALDYAIWKNNPIGYHLTSIILHSINGILLFIFLHHFFKRKYLAFTSSVLFIIHPVQTEAVTYASGRTDLLSSFFCLICLNLVSRISMDNKKRIIFYLLSIFTFSLALLSKETALIIPLLIILLTIHQTKRFSKKGTDVLFFTFPFILIDLIYTIIRLTILNFSNTLNFYPVANIYSQNLHVRLFTFTEVFFDYLILLLFPVKLIFARSVSYITSPFNLWVILFILMSVIIYFVNKKYFPDNIIFSFSVIWILISLLPVSGIIPINNIIAEHYLYFPSIGFFLIISSVFLFFWGKYTFTNFRLVLISFSAVSILLLTVRTIVRNLDYRDAIKFYTISLAQSPWHVPMRHNLAMTYADMGNFEIAVREYKHLIASADYYPQVHHNLANAYVSLGNYHGAEEEYNNALKMDPGFMFSYYGLAKLYKILGNEEKYNETLKIINRK